MPYRFWGLLDSCLAAMAAGCKALFHWSTGKMEDYIVDIVLPLS
jgi:hypothetical protein